MKYLLLLLLLPFYALGQRVKLQSTPDVTLLNGIAYWYEPKDGAEPLPQMVWKNPGNYPFVKGSRHQEFFNSDNIPVYARFSVEGEPGSLACLVVDNANVDSLDLWYQYKDSTRHLQAGSFMPQPGGMPANTKFIFPLNIDGKTQRVLLRARTRKRLILPLALLKPLKGYTYIFRQIVPELIMLGMVLMLVLYNLIRLFYSKNKQRLWYVLYLLALIGYAFLYIRGYGHFLGVTGQAIITRLGVAFGALAYIFAMLFSWHYLDRSKAPSWYLRLFKLAFSIPVFTLLVDLAGMYRLSYTLLLAMGLLVPLFMLFFAFLVYRKGDIATIYFFAGWTSVSFSVIINSLLVLKIIDASFKQIPQILLALTCLEMLLLSAGMGFRATLVSREKVALQAKLVSLLQNQKQELEQQVAVRTQELQQSLQSVEESNAIKARLLAIISHDLRMPFVSLNAALDLLSLNILSPQKAQQKLATIKSNIKNIAGTLENLLTWSKMQQQKIATLPEALPFEAFCQETSALLQTSFESKQIKLKMDTESKTRVFADRFQLETILRNLLSNAIKASPPGSIIRIGCKPAPQQEDHYCITITDAGPGIQEPSLAAWLHQQTGIPGGGNLANGLGLQICQEFLALHKSALSYTHSGTGSTFSFLLPAATAIPVHEKAPQEILQG